MDTGVGFINLDDSVKIALNIALAVARENANECYTPSHLLKALLHKDVGLRDFIISIGKDLGYLEEWADVYIEQCPKSTRLSEIKPSEQIDSVFRAADDARIQFGLFDINPICVLLALTKPGVAFSSDQLRSFHSGKGYPFHIYRKRTAGMFSCRHGGCLCSGLRLVLFPGKVLRGPYRGCGKQAASGHQPRP